MALSEQASNIRAAMRILRRVDAAGMHVEGLPNTEVLIQGDPRPTVRRPDLVFVRSDPPVQRYRLSPEEVLAVVEVLSPATATVDRIQKVAEYASVGIPVYLLVDMRSPEAATLALYTDPRGWGLSVHGRGSGSDPAAGGGVQLRADELVSRSGPTPS